MATRRFDLTFSSAVDRMRGKRVKDSAVGWLRPDIWKLSMDHVGRKYIRLFYFFFFLLLRNTNNRRYDEYRHLRFLTTIEF